MCGYDRAIEDELENGAAGVNVLVERDGKQYWITAATWVESGAYNGPYEVIKVSYPEALSEVYASDGLLITTDPDTPTFVPEEWE
jgi:hypothetical protein